MSYWWKLIFTKFKLSPIFLVSPVLPPLVWLFHVPTWSLNRKMNLYKTWDYRILSHAQPLIYCGTLRVLSFFFFILICVILLGKRTFLNSRFILTGLKWVSKRTTLVLAISNSRVEPYGPSGFYFFFFSFFFYLLWPCWGWFAVLL